MPPDHIRERVDYVIDLLGIDALREANPYQLSGGEKHLVALASVLALNPPVLVLDEVMSQLDSMGREKWLPPCRNCVTREKPSSRLSMTCKQLLAPTD